MTFKSLAIVLLLFLTTASWKLARTQNISFVLSLRIFGSPDAAPLSQAAIDSVAGSVSLAFQINSIVFLNGSHTTGDPLCIYGQLAFWDAKIMANGDAEYMANVLAIPSSFITVRLSFLTALNQGGLPSSYMYARHYATNITENPPASVLKVGATVKLFNFWIKVEGVGDLLPIPMCHSTTFVSLWTLNTTAFAFIPLTMDAIQMVRVGGDFFTSSTTSGGQRRLLEGGVRTDVLEMEMEVQTSDPTASQGTMETFFRSENQQALVAQLQRSNVPVTSVTLMNVTIFQGLSPPQFVSSSVTVPSAPSFAPVTAPQGAINNSPTSVGGTHKGRLSTGVILGISGALLVFLVVTGVLGLLLWRRRQHGLSPGSIELLVPRLVEGFPTLEHQDIKLCKHEDGSDWLLGAGSYGQVLKGRYGQEYVAVKRLYAHVAHCLSYLFENEVKILTMASYGEHVVQLFGVVPSSSSNGQGPMLVMELMQLGDLCALISKDSLGQYSWQNKGKKIALDVALGMAFLHSLKIIHRDLKSSNIFVNNSGVAKIGDVGLARVMSTSMVNHSGELAGTFDYTAPEILMGGDYSEKVDCYSFGVLLWEICACELPRRGKLHDLRFPEDCPQEINDLINSCTHPDPENRPSAQEIVNLLQTYQ